MRVEAKPAILRGYWSMERMVLPGKAVKREPIDVTPHRSLLEKIGSVDFTVSESISELIANSLDATVEGQKAHVVVLIDPKEIAVKDDCRGMTKAVLKESVRLANPMDDFVKYSSTRKSVYGLGLKTACASLGRRWSIETTPEGSHQVYRVEFDLDKWTAAGRDSWSVEMETLEKPTPHFSRIEDSGTAVVVTRLKVKPNVDAVRDDLALAYAPHLLAGDEIKVNGDALTYQEPKVRDKTRRDIDIHVGKHHVKGWAGIMEEASMRGRYGFHLYRQDQLIAAFDKSFTGIHPNYSRVIGALHLDHVPTNYNKKGFNTESQEWKEALEVLKKELRSVARESHETFMHGGKKITEKDQRDIGEAVAEMAESAGTDTQGGTAAAGEGSEGTGKVSASQDSITVAGMSFYFNHNIEDMNDPDRIRDWFFDPEARDLTVIINQGSNLFKESKDLPLLAKFCVADAVAEFLVSERRLDFKEAIAFRDRLLNAAPRLKTVSAD